MILDVQSHGNHSGPFGSGGPNGGPPSIELALKLQIQTVARSFQNQ
jgi:hypothetical protein